MNRDTATTARTHPCGVLCPEPMDERGQHAAGEGVAAGRADQRSCRSRGCPGQAGTGAAASTGGEPRLLALLCYWCSYSAADFAGIQRQPAIANYRAVRIRCSSSVSTALLLEMFKMGIDIGLGTDGPMSSNQMDILNVMNHAAGVARFLGQDATRFTPYELVYMATMGGARSLDMEDRIGSLERGKKADIIVVDVHAPNMQPNYDVYATLAFAAYPENVRTTIVNGRVVVDDRVLQKVAMDEHMKEWRNLTKRVAEYAKTLE